LEKGRHKIIILDEADSMTDGAQQVNFCFVDT
jgi:DNA polymerase III delta prime subunit